MIYEARHLSMKKPPSLGDTIILNQVEYIVSGSPIGFCLLRDGQKNQRVGLHQTLRSLITAVQEIDIWRAPKTEKLVYEGVRDASV